MSTSRRQFLDDLKSELAKLGIEASETKRGLKAHTREQVLHLKPPTLDEKVCVAAGYIIERPAMKIYYGWRANPSHFLDLASDNRSARRYSNLPNVIRAASSKFPTGQHSSVGVWVVDKYCDNESAAELAKILKSIR
jgi:hypothetical protein